jgi:NAD(P)-dependent dehydrogenase (short-subunit alcohol dehydrogenase family)
VRVVIVGGSSGLGRCIGVGLTQRGNQVALLARRLDRLQGAAEEAGEGAFPVACDVTDEASIRTAIAQAADALGGIDALLYAPAISPLCRLADTDADTWARIFATNVTGAALVTAAALPHLGSGSGKVLYLSSVTASVSPPWPGLGAYAASKAALDKLVEAWRGEHPEIRFTRVVVGDCAGGAGDAMTGIASDWDMDLAAELATTWIEGRYMTGKLLEVEHLIEVVDTVLNSGISVSIPSVFVIPNPAGPEPDPFGLNAAAEADAPA